MRHVVIESPLAGDFKRNRRYALWCARHCYTLGEAAYASHLFYPCFLDDQVAEERAFGIEAGFAWSKAVGAVHIFYVDLGWSSGMSKARDAIASQAARDGVLFAALAALDAARLGPEAAYDDAMRGPLVAFDEAMRGPQAVFNDAERGPLAALSTAQREAKAAYDDAMRGPQAAFDDVIRHLDQPTPRVVERGRAAEERRLPPEMFAKFEAGEYPPSTQGFEQS